ncbi:NAD-dependent succinate-semialdehyde dehydrogenase [Flavisphingomonas formosensis]|uniref:NAD-dependent succinate-semialdehyde dehydrogenase n=1 Tax=Flavisphingomonas formosensis TaxID=861534 RepID=UPI0022B75EC5|nr:NAD-dependent succinate-semialdehyde dehydrogenase [Sphingomonas formosensis]
MPPSADEPAFEVRNPADDSLLALVPDMSVEDTRAAIIAAEGAFRSWSRRPAGERAAILRSWNDLVLAHQDDLARLLTLEQGKPLAEARAEVRFAASFIAWFSEEARRIYGDVLSLDHSEQRGLVLKQPVGVVAAITPWNFPAAMITRKVAPALAAGCAVIVKPAEATPLTALALQRLAVQAGVPKDGFAVITSQSAEAVGAELCGNPTVRKLSFTGSTAVGKRLMAACADTVKRLSLELGGNAPFIVFDDADLDAAVAGAVTSKFRNAGQTCVCSNRILVQDGIYDVFAERLAAAVGKLTIGSGVTEGVTIGPLIDIGALEKIESIVLDATLQGASVLAGGHRHDLGGSFYAPTVLGDVTPSMACMTTEIFGPVAPLVRFSTEEQALAMANDTRSGLAGYFYSRDLNRAWRVAEALECGMVGINTGLVSSEIAPFGGIKESGLGREGSKYGIDEYIEQKYVCFGGVS